MYCTEVSLYATEHHRHVDIPTLTMLSICMMMLSPTLRRYFYGICYFVNYRAEYCGTRYNRDIQTLAIFSAEIS